MSEILVDPAVEKERTTEKRVALVVGNASYQNSVKLRNPANDACAIAASLRSMDFDVVERVDQTVLGMDECLKEFNERMGGADAALLFYAGHGLQVDGENYLVPIDAELSEVGQLKQQTISLNDQLWMMSKKSAVSIVILDCCRDNPFVRSLGRLREGATRSAVVSRGLAEVVNDEGSFVAFATAPGSVAKDGDGPHSPFTQALLAHIGTPAMSLADIMTDVTNAVTEATQEFQVPWYHSSLRKRFFFKPPALKQEPVVNPIPVEDQHPSPDPIDPNEGIDDRSASGAKTDTSTNSDERKKWHLLDKAGLITIGLAIIFTMSALGLRFLITKPSTSPLNAAQLINRLNSTDSDLADEVAAYLSGEASDAEKKQLLGTVVQRMQSQLIYVDANAAIPSNCRAPTPRGPSSTPRLPLLCAGLDAESQAQAVSLLLSIPGEIWQNSKFKVETGMALVAVADIDQQRRKGSDQFLSDGTVDLNMLMDRLPMGIRPDNLVTLQFGGNFPRGNAQTIMDRLVSFGWRIQGVERAQVSSNEVRHGVGNDENATKLTKDVALMGLTIPPSVTPSLTGNDQLDIYTMTPLPVWGETRPQSGWCYQENDPSKAYASRNLVACHPTQPACFKARGNAPQKRQSDCVFVEDLDDMGVSLTGGGWANSWFATSADTFPEPFPALPD